MVIKALGNYVKMKAQKVKEGDTTETFCLFHIDCFDVILEKKQLEDYFG